MEKPQIICHIEKSLPFTLYDALWIPSSAKFVVLGSQPRGSGVFQIYEINESEACVVKNVEKNTAFKCGTFGASSLRQRNLATGDFEGRLQIWGLEDLSTPIYSVNAHKQIINCIDGAGGLSIGCGAPEIVTGSRDGKALENHGIKVTNVTGQKLKETANIVEKEFLRSVKVWDPRQKNKPVAVMEPVEGETRRDCWSVAFGNSYNTEERVVCAGYDNGDIKMFDLKTMSLRWETNVKNGVCCVEFDRKDIKMNKLIATSLESKFHVYDLKTYHPKKGFAKFSEKAHKSTIWVGRSLPQNREIFATCGGGGTLCIWKYNYPEKRERETSEGEKVGVAGTVSLLQNSVLSSQPLSSFQWSPDKTGLAVCTSFDQIVRVVIVTKLNLY